jgi:hypothetical protein
VASVRRRLGSRSYRQSLEELDRLDREPFTSFAGARREVLTKRGIEQVRAWLRYRIREPRFDDPAAQMPRLGISDGEAASIANYLLREEEEGIERGVLSLLGRIIPQLKYRHLLASFGLGFCLALFLVALLRQRR